MNLNQSSTTDQSELILFKELLKDSVEQHFRKGEFIYQQGEISKGIFVVKKGIVGLKHVTLSGREHLLRFFKCDNYFGHRSFLTDDIYHATAVALEPCVLAFIPKQQMWQALNRNIHLYQSLAKVLAQELKKCELQRVLILENQILARTAQAIVYLKELFPTHNWTRQEIADFVASTPTTIIKALAELENRQLIAQEGRRIDILNRDELLNIEEDAVF